MDGTLAHCIIEMTFCDITDGGTFCVWRSRSACAPRVAYRFLLAAHSIFVGGISRRRPEDGTWHPEGAAPAALYAGSRAALYSGPRAAPYDGPRAAPYDVPRAAHGTQKAAPYDGPRAAPYEGPMAALHDGPRAAPYTGPRAAPYDGPRAAPYDGPRAVHGHPRAARGTRWWYMAFKDDTGHPEGYT